MATPTLEALTVAPAFGDFTPLDEHQSQTPGTFFGSKPVLHLHCPQAKVKGSKEQLQSHSIISSICRIPQIPNGVGNGTSDEDVVLDGMDVWVTSKYLQIWSPQSCAGIQIAYPRISLAALDGDAVLLELVLDHQLDEEEDYPSMQMRILPNNTQKREEDQSATTVVNGERHVGGPQALYEALFACQELNPSPDDDAEEEEEDEETEPGATGWITADSAQDFLDEDGNFRIPEQDLGNDDEVAGNGGELGPGAGRVRSAHDAGADGAADEPDDTKWRRTG